MNTKNLVLFSQNCDLFFEARDAGDGALALEVARENKELMARGSDEVKAVIEYQLAEAHTLMDAYDKAADHYSTCLELCGSSTEKNMVQLRCMSRKALNAMPLIREVLEAKQETKQ